MNALAPWLILAAAVLVILWGARSLDRYERRLALDEAGLPYSPFVSEDDALRALDEIRALPEVTAA